MRPIHFAIIAAFLLGSTPSVGHAQSLLHAFDFTSDGVVVDSHGGAQGSLEGGALVTGGVLRLDGINDYVQFDSHLVPHSGAFSVSFFAKRAGEQGGGHIEWISQGSSGGPGFYIGYNYSSDGATNYIRITDNHNSSSNPSFPTDLLEHHVAVTTDGNNTWYYLDGVLNTTFTGGCPTTTGGTHTRFGRQFVGAEYFHGDIDEMRIFSGTVDSCYVATLAGRGDCDSNGQIDCDEILLDPNLDCDADDVLDSCQIDIDPSLDCDGNGLIDSCEILADASLDCDGDLGLDSCQIALNPSLDWDGDGVLDSCTGGGPNYCDAFPNSAGLVGVIHAEGSPLLSAADLTLVGEQLPVNKWGYFLMSATPLDPGIPYFGGSSGVLCLAAPQVRFNGPAGYSALNSGLTGSVSMSPDFAALPQSIIFQPGDVWHFQLWYRDDIMTTPTSNTTDAIRVMFR